MSATALKPSPICHRRFQRPQTIVAPMQAGFGQRNPRGKLRITRSDATIPLELGNAVLGGGFYSTRLSIDLRKNSGLVYSVRSALQAGRTRTLYFVQYASDPHNVTKAASIVAQEIKAMQTTPASEDELVRVKALLVRQISLSEADVDDIASGLLARSDLGLPLDEPTTAARRYIELRPADVQAAFRRWMRPEDLVRVSEGPTPQRNAARRVAMIARRPSVPNSLTLE